MRTLAAVMFLLGALPAMADVDLVAKRELCHAEARKAVKPRGHASAEFAQLLIERRMELVRECMDRPVVAGKADPKATGALPQGRRR